MLEPHHHIWPDISLGTETAESLFWLGEHIPGGFFVYRENETQDLLYANGTTLRIFGCDTMEEFKELTGGNFRGMVHPKDYEQIQASIEQQIIEDDTHKFDYVEYRIVRKDGQIRWVEDYGHLVTIPKYGD
ncbi:MAG: PAS domain-containing protein, partial [Atopobiaceae bacterium]|nr:PAS domain-containing protein [Atopobiaceae bacterium]